MTTPVPAPRTPGQERQPARVDVEVTFGDWNESVDLARLGALAAAAAGEATGEIGIRLAGDGEVQELNRQHRGYDKPTNVLSFPATVADAFGLPAMLGDVILAFETARGEASDLGISLTDHAGHLVVHGVLHLRGYDHQTDAGAQSMEDEERRVLASFGIHDPYARLDAKADIDG